MTQYFRTILVNYFVRIYYIFRCKLIRKVVWVFNIIIIYGKFDVIGEKKNPFRISSDQQETSPVRYLMRNRFEMYRNCWIEIFCKPFGLAVNDGGFQFSRGYDHQ